MEIATFAKKLKISTSFSNILRVCTFIEMISWKVSKLSLFLKKLSCLVSVKK